jgi:hypothetical protein
MPQLGGVFDLFPELDAITAGDIIALSSQQFEHHFVENHLANRVLYPQSVAVTKQELDLDFFILEVAVSRHPEIFFDQNQNRIVIPDKAVVYFPPLARLISTILLSTPDDKVTDIWLKSQSEQKILGSCIPLSLIQAMNIAGEVKITIQNEEKTLIPGQLNLIPVKEKQVRVDFNQTNFLTAVGGSLGIFVDLRSRKT